MYVKVTAGHSMGGDFLLQIPSDEIHSGTTVIPFDPEKMDGGDGLGANDVGQRLWEALDFHGEFWHRLHVLEIDPKQTHYEEKNGWLAVRFAWWFEGGGSGISRWDEGSGISGVVTTRNIFIVGENGQTIDKVR